MNQQRRSSLVSLPSVDIDQDIDQDTGVDPTDEGMSAGEGGGQAGEVAEQEEGNSLGTTTSLRGGGQRGLRLWEQQLVSDNERLTVRAKRLEEDLAASRLRVAEARGALDATTATQRVVDLEIDLHRALR